MEKILILAALAAAGLIWNGIENRIFVVHHYSVLSARIPRAFSGCRLLYLVDLHNTAYGRQNNRLKRAIEKENPDYVLVGGDFLSRSDRDGEIALDLLEFLSERYPTYFANGNHETKMQRHPEDYHNLYPSFRARASAHGCRFLDGADAWLERAGQRIALQELELSEEYFDKLRLRQLTREDVERQIGKKDASQYVILLAHTPNYFATYAQWGADLTLSGHNHGGMVRIPGIGGLLSPQAFPFPRYTKGRYTKGESQMLVSAGLGSHTVRVRLFNPPELLSITLECPDERRTERTHYGNGI